MKQVISIADFAIILDIINEKIHSLEYHIFPMNKATEEEMQKQIEENLRRLKKDPFYQSLIHAKKALEECKVEIEVPDLEVEK